MAKVFEELQETGRAGASKGTAGKEDGVATFGQGKAGKKGRGTTLFVSNEPFMFREGSHPVGHHLLAHCQKHSSRVKPDLGRTDRCAEAAEITGKGELLAGFAVWSPGRSYGPG